MDKNTIWAIVLSTLVIVGFFFLQPLVMGKNGGEAIDQQVVETTDSVEYADATNNTSNELLLSEAVVNETKEELSEETVIINTKKAEIVLTNKGGDIISYKLLEHKDTDTNDGIQISDSISDINRTCGIALGDANAKIISDYFTTDKIDDYTVLFKRNFAVLLDDGSVRNFTLGKKYSFKENEYLFKLDVLLHGDGDLSILNKNGAAYTLRTSPQIGPHFNQKENRYDNRQYITYNGKKMKRTVLGSNQFRRNDKDFIWSAIAGKYFVEIVVPSIPDTINAGYYSSLIEQNNYSNAQALIERKTFSGTDISDSYYLYFGPRNEKDMKVYNMPETNSWGFGGYRITEALQSSGWLGWLETILKFCLEWINKVVHNWGLSIIVMTILLKFALFPLSKKQSMSTLKMQEIQPKMQALQEKYKNDQARLQQEMGKLYKEAGYNPASGCLPMLFQFLVIFAMYNLFNNYFEFRGASFIPGWIPDLSAGDSVFKLPFVIPLLQWTQIRILPVIYVITQLFFGKITNYGGSAPQGQNAATMKFMMYGMPIMFFFVLYNAPSGLFIYWIISNIFQMGQQIIINKMMAKKKAEIAAGKTGEKQAQKTLPPKNKRK